MPLTVVADKAVQQAGNVLILFGPKITTLSAPSLAAFTTDVTCATRQFSLRGEPTFKEDQSYCDVEARQTLEKRVVSLSMRFRVDSTTYAALKTLFALDAEVGGFHRPFTPTKTAATVGNKGTAFNAKVAGFEFTEGAVGNEWEVDVAFYDVRRDVDAVLAA